MKLRALLFILLCFVGMSSHAATEIITAHVAITNAPLGNTNTITVNASTRTWTNSVSSSLSTLIQQTNSIPYSATNLWLQLGTYPASAQHVLIMTNGSNVVSLRGGVGEALSVSISAGWATLTFTTNTVSTPTYVVRVPFRLEGLQDQTNIASGVIEILQKSTNALGTNWVATSNLVNRYHNQDVYGNKTWLGTNSFTNSSWRGGTIAQVTNLSGYIGSLTNGYLTNVYAETFTVTNLYVPGAGSGSIAIQAPGFTTDASGQGAIAIGGAAVASGVNDVVIGSGAEGAWGNGVIIGTGAAANATNQIVIGNGAVGAGANSIVLGNGAQSTTSNQVRLATSTYTVSIPGALEASQVNMLRLVGSITNDAKWSSPASSFTTLGNGNNIAVDFGSNYWIHLDGTITTDSAICGIVGGFDGVEYFIFNNTGYGVTFAQNTVDPTPANRIVNYTGSDYALVTGGFLRLIYDSASARWRTIPLYPITAAATNAVAIVQTNAVDFGSGNNRLNFVPGFGTSILATNATGTSTVGIASQTGWLLTNGVVVGQSTNLNLVPGSGITFLVTNLNGSNIVGISSTASGGWTWAETNVTTYASNTTDIPHIIQPLTGTSASWFRINNTNGVAAYDWQWWTNSLYLTNIDASNWSRFQVAWNNSTRRYELRSTSAGTGTNAPIAIMAGTTTGVLVDTNGNVTVGGGLTTTALGDITSAQDLIAARDLTLGAGRYLTWLTSTRFRAPSDGSMLIANNALNGFSTLSLGLNTAVGRGIQLTNIGGIATLRFGGGDGGTYPTNDVNVPGSLLVSNKVCVQPQTGLTGYSLDVRGTNGGLSLTVSNETGYINASTNLYVKAGPSTAWGRVGGVVYFNSTLTTNTGAGETDAMAHNIPARALSATGDSYEFYCAGRFATNMASKQVKIYIASTVICDLTSLVMQGGSWKIRGEVIKTGASTQRCTVDLIAFDTTSVAVADTYITETAETDTSAIQLKATLQGAATGDATIDVWKERFEPAP